ncbi:MAG: slipin family protein [Planctomycetes bacterium]|nr:slipin family protein [Planctomycetota bacterium]
MEYGIVVVVLCAVALWLVTAGVRRVTIFEFEKGLRYVKGRFAETLGPGRHWFMPFSTTIQKVDVRPRFVSITGQEVLSSDGVTLKVSLAANYEVVDPNTAVNKTQSFEAALYLELQLALREIVGAADIDTVLNSRDQLSRTLAEKTEAKAKALGLRLISVNLKDIMFPGKLKEMFAQVVNARKEGLAALEKARGETAALRNLANAARMIEANPALMQLRLVQALGQSSGNTLILGMPSQATPVPIRTREAVGGTALPGGAGEASGPEGASETT